MGGGWFEHRGVRLGALVPVLPYLVACSYLWLLVLSAVALFAAGAVVSRFTSRTWLYSGGRQLMLGVAAAAVTYLIGHLVGTSVT